MKVPLPTALTILGAAFVVSYLIATSAEPVTIKKYPEEPERNYTLETLRTLNPPPPPKIEYYRGRYPGQGYMLSTMMYWPDGSGEYARINQPRINQWGNVCDDGACNR